VRSWVRNACGGTLPASRWSDWYLACSAAWIWRRLAVPWGGAGGGGGCGGQGASERAAGWALAGRWLGAAWAGGGRRAAGGGRRAAGGGRRAAGGGRRAAGGGRRAGADVAHTRHMCGGRPSHHGLWVLLPVAPARRVARDPLHAHRHLGEAVLGGEVRVKRLLAQAAVLAVAAPPLRRFGGGGGGEEEGGMQRPARSGSRGQAGQVRAWRTCVCCHPVLGVGSAGLL
jgi:hypothetical protein